MFRIGCVHCLQKHRLVPPEPKTAFTVDSEPASEPSAENNAAAPVSTQPTGPQPPENNDDLPDWLKNFEIEATSEPETKDDFS